MLLRVVTSCILPEIARAVAGRAGLAAAGTAHASLAPRHGRGLIHPRSGVHAKTLQSGDEVEIGIENIGVLVNVVAYRM